MNKQFKQLMLRIAALPKRDQRWMLKQLNSQQAHAFAQYNGVHLLKNARRFAALPCLEQPVVENASLPVFCHALLEQPPLYVALILEQGNFSWEQRFRTQYHELHPHQILPEVLPQKVATKHALFNQWHSSLSFADQLEIDNGATD